MENKQELKSKIIYSRHYFFSTWCMNNIIQKLIHLIYINAKRNIRCTKTTMDNKIRKYRDQDPLDGEIRKRLAQSL